MAQPRWHNHVPPQSRTAVGRIIESYNPGITLLVSMWVVAFAIRERLLQAGPIEQMADNALRSLLLVIPIMLVGWGALHILDKRFRLGLFK